MSIFHISWQPPLKGMDSRLHGNDFGADQFDYAQVLDPRLRGDDR